MINKISKRLITIASFLPKGVYFADIGSDHAYLPCYVCKNDKEARAIAGEINRGPFEIAKKTTETYKLTNVIDVRLGNGLEIINNEPISHVVIAGMGGALIKNILSEGSDKLKDVKQLILQPNLGAHHLRRWLYENNYIIVTEVIIEENDHFYEIIIADKTDSYSSESLTEKQIMFGPFLLEEKSKHFYEKWMLEKEQLKIVIDDMQQATKINKQKLTHFKNKLAWIEEVLSIEN